eukprot:scaffold219819_cov24-Prasinocladus_malaysianus.AAC.1
MSNSFVACPERMHVPGSAATGQHSLGCTYLPGPANIASLAASACLSDALAVTRRRLPRPPDMSNRRLSVDGRLREATYAARSRNLLM